MKEQAYVILIGSVQLVGLGVLVMYARERYRGWRRAWLSLWFIVKVAMIWMVLKVMEVV